MRGTSSTIAIGLVPHTGWTWLVRVGADRTVEARHRIVALAMDDAGLYHLARDHHGDRARFLADRRTVALAAAIAAVAAPASGATHAIVLGKQPALPALEAIVASHARIHTAEGELWRALFAEACAACGLAVRRADRAGARDERWLAGAGDALGAPWTSEIKDAATAAVAELSARGSSASSPRSMPRGPGLARRIDRPRGRGRSGRSSRP
jgi:hypothetical protein